MAYLLKSLCSIGLFHPVRPSWFMFPLSHFMVFYGYILILTALFRKYLFREKAVGTIGMGLFSVIDVAAGLAVSCK